jgi:hypothetical protein
LAFCVLVVALDSCESGDVHLFGPNGRDSFTQFIAIGTGLSMGVQSAGVLYNSQVESWPALLAHMAGSGFTQPLLRSPGCTPPLVAPLQFGRVLSGASVTPPDSSCNGVLDSATPPLENLAISGATAFTALNLTPKLISAAPANFSVGDRLRYPFVLGTTQSQVTAMLVENPTLVSVELGSSEILGAVTSGLMIAAGTYNQAAAYSYVSAAVFAPVYSVIADSVKQSRARAMLLSVPRVSSIVSLRAGAELYADRVALAASGIAVAAGCNGSPNLIFTPAVVPVLAARAQSLGVVQNLSCDDVPGTADYVLTPADAATLNGVADQINVQIKSLADQNGWAYVDANAVFGSFVAVRAPYSSAIELSCNSPYGQYISLDGLQPTLAGNQLIANAAAAALNARYGFTLPQVPVAPVSQAQLCP